jgi:predicted GNAT family N-acyltransferase
MIRGQIISGAAGGAALQDAFTIREAVFVHEQGYSLDTERDGHDYTAAHAVIYEDEIPIATGRLFIDEESRWHIGRVAVMQQARGRGVGDLLMRMLLSAAVQFSAERVYLGSQEHAVGFYEKLGFAVYGEPYLDEGQPHRHMVIDEATMARLFAGCSGCADGSGCSGCGGDCPAHAH